MHTSFRQQCRRCPVLAARLVAILCCLLVLLPAITVRVLVQRSVLQETTEESRQTNEEERASEDLIAMRSHGRRTREECRTSPPLVSHRGASSCGHSNGRSQNTLFLSSMRVEHQLRNGVGAPLRC
jgi:hypothetical protein